MRAQTYVYIYIYTYIGIHTRIVQGRVPSTTCMRMRVFASMSSSDAFRRMYMCALICMHGDVVHFFTHLCVDKAICTNVCRYTYTHIFVQMLGVFFFSGSGLVM